MTAEKERSSSTPVLARATVVLAALGLVACSTVGSPPGSTDKNTGNADDPTNDGDGNANPGDDGDGTANPGDDGDGTTNPGDDTDDGDDEGSGVIPCGEAAENAYKAVETYCVSCHGEQPQGNSLGNILDSNRLVATGRIIPDDAANSPFFIRIENNTMPPGNIDKRPEQADINAIRDWIQCGAEDWTPGGAGAPLPFLSLNDRLELMADDIEDQANPEDIRYFDLTALSNAGFSESQLQTYRQAFFFSLNSLSLGLRVVTPDPIDDNELIYRIDLEDYGWDAQKWDLLTAGYPYGVVYDDDSELFPVNEDDAETIRDEAEDDIPFIYADWFMANALVAPLYNELLELPPTIQELAADLGIDILENIADEQVVRSGFLSSGPSDANRMIERHEIRGGQGALWVSYDFEDNLVSKDNDIFSEPIDFTADGGEAIFNLPNGLQAYYVMAGNVLAGQGASLNIAPINVVQDPASFDGQVINGLSCTNCHAVVGIIPKNDEIRDHVLTNGDDQLDTVLALYPTRNEMQDHFEDDANRYRSAIQALGITELGERTMHTVHQRHLDELNIDDVAAVLGIENDRLLQALDSSIAQLPAAMSALRRANGTVDRDTLEESFPDLVRAIGLGAAIRPQ